MLEYRPREIMAIMAGRMVKNGDVVFCGTGLSLIAAAIKQKSLGFVLAIILSCGIFEIPAVIIGEAAALSFGMVAIVHCFQHQRDGSCYRISSRI